MEFYAYAEIPCEPERLQRELTVARLPHWCPFIERILRDEGDAGELFCGWGQFTVHREAIRGGVRFTLPNCPNALQWTVTVGLPPEPGRIVVHCTINRPDHEPDFVESIEDFVQAWAAGLTRHLRPDP